MRDIILFGRTSVFQVFDTIFFPSSVSSFYLFSLLAFLTFYFFYTQKRWIFLVLGLMAAVMVPIVFRFGVEQKLFAVLFDQTNYPVDVSVASFFRDNYRYAFRYISFGVIFYFYRYATFKQKREYELQVENQKIELSMLRAQVNPHFLLNSLNNIYSLVYHKSDKSLEALERLTTMLKYSLYTQRDFVSIEEELEIVKAYVALQSIRYEDASPPVIDVDPAMYSQQIPQFAIVPLVENAYKHGKLDEQKRPFTLSVRSIGDSMEIQCSNIKSFAEKDDGSGVGLVNLRKRLELLYPDKNSLLVREEDDIFNITITFPKI